MKIEESESRRARKLTSSATLVMACVVSLAAAGWRSLPAAEPGGEALLQEQLAAGEFAPAFDAAQQAEPQERDARLRAVALAQAEAGDRTASYATARSMRDDLARSQTLSRIENQPPQGAGGGGGGSFGDLISLITETVQPTTWEDVGGPGTIKTFANGVFVDTAGVVRRVETERGLGRLSELHRSAALVGTNPAVRQTSALRKVSLPRLEREVQMRLAAGKPLDEEMLLLAGLQRIQYVMVYPETGDLVLAGPAGDWRLDQENRLVGAESGRPVVELDDLVTLLRHAFSARDAEFGCSIDPTEEGLAKAKTFLDESGKKPLKPGQRGKWLEEVRSRVGRQNVRVFGIDPQSHVAHVMIEADYRMKLVGIGLERSVLDVPSYLELLKAEAKDGAAPLDVLRWWFTVNYDALLAGGDRNVYELRGQGVKVLSENEFLTAAGQQVHTGKSQPANAEFARRFTKHFAELAAKYPVYAELQNVFDTALVASLIKSEGLADRVGWHMVCFRNPQEYVVNRGEAPHTVDSVANSLVVRRTQILAAVSGGVTVDCRRLVEPSAIEIDRKGSLGSEHSRSEPDAVPQASWWWD